jgi:hypothetical protein
MMLTLIAACGQPVHLQYDLGRAYEAAWEIQSDLSRPTVADEAYAVSGTEALAVRQNAENAAAAKKTGDVTMKAASK